MVATDGNSYFRLDRRSYRYTIEDFYWFTKIYYSEDGNFDNYSMSNPIQIENWNDFGIANGTYGLRTREDDSKIFYGRGLFLVTSKGKIYYFDTTNMSLAQANCPEGYYIK